MSIESTLKEFSIRTASAARIDNILQINQANQENLSVLNIVQLKRLLDIAFASECVGDVDALLIAFDQDAAYDSPNFLWCKQRFARFIYVDRVVVAAQQRRRGHARRLYEALFKRAMAAGHERVLCEVNAEPPNPGSDAFHAQMGFTEIGSGEPSPGKRVVYLCRSLREWDGACP